MSDVTITTYDGPTVTPEAVSATITVHDGGPGLQGDPGAPGADGASAYEVAVANGFVGTEAEWLASLAAGGAVSSVNGDVGDVVLSAADVGALPDTYVPAYADLTGKPTIPDSADDIGAETPAGAQSKVDAHAADTTAVHGIADTSLLATTADVSAASTADRARGNHTGTQTSATISDFTEAVQDAVAALLTSGSNVTLTYNDAGNSLTVTAAGGDAEVMRDTIGAALAGVGNIAVTVNDAADTITISTTATVNSTDAALRDRSTHTGTQSADTLTDGTTNKAFLATERTKLAGVATGATANDTDANLKNRANHTGSQTSSTISDLTETVQDLVAAMVVAGANVTKTYDDTAGTLTLTASGSSTSYGILDQNVYAPAATTQFTPTASTTDVDATNAAVTFTVPDTGVVYVHFACGQLVSNNSGFLLCLREGTTTVPKTWVRRGYYGTAVTSGAQLGVTASWVVTGLTPGSVHTYKVGYMKNGPGATASTLICGNADDPTNGGWGQMVTVVSAAPL